MEKNVQVVKVTPQPCNCGNDQRWKYALPGALQLAFVVNCATNYLEGKITRDEHDRLLSMICPQA